MVLYTCEKCNKEFNQKSNYLKHINRKKPCISNESNIIIYKCEKCNKDFNYKTSYLYHINKINSCYTVNFEEKCNSLEIELINLKKDLELLTNKNIILENENKTLNNLVNKCLENNKTIKTNNTTNNNNTNNINNTINNINVNLVPFGMENLDDLTPEEKKTILNAGMFCSVMCAKKLNCNPRLPQYQNIAFTNLRSNDAKIYDKDKTWKTVDKEDLFETVIPRRIDDVNLLIENEDIKISPYMDNLVKKGTDEDEVVKNTKIKKRFHRTVYDFDKNKNKDKKKLT
jgi:DNA-directed RNA polymerase subunit RPC12/RpoP